MIEICAVLEHTGATLHEHSSELLSELVDISRLQPTPAAVCAALLVSHQEELPDISLLPKLGIHHLYILEHPLLAHYSTESHVDTLAWFIQQRAPMLVATSATPYGRDWTPRLAAQLRLPFVPNCLNLDIHDDGLFALRSIHEGRAYVQTRTALHGRTALATFIPGVRGVPAKIQQDSASTSALEIGSPPSRVNHRARLIAATAGDDFSPSRSAMWCHPERSEGSGSMGTEMLSEAKHDMTGLEGENPLTARAHQSPQRMEDLEITSFVPIIQHRTGHERVRRIAVQPPLPEEVELDAAERIVAGGRGVGQEGFTTVAAFARLLDAAVGATRVATDLGWVEHARQIGSTGKIVRPRLYIACGISGAVQHTSGMSEAQTVIAINPDRSAPIFALADLGLLGDANQILPLAAKLLEQS